MVRLKKRTSNVFRTRAAATAPRLDVSWFDGVLSVDPVARTADVLGMTTYEHLVDATLPYGLMPLVVPQLKTITLGGAVTGMGIEASSFRNGLPHESVIEMDVLTGDGRIVTARRGQRARRPLLRLPELLRLARLRLAAADRARAGEDLRPGDARALRRPGRVRRPARRGLHHAPGRRRRAGRLRRRQRLLGHRALPDDRDLRRRGALLEQLLRPADLLPLDPGPQARLPHRPRLHLALGHRLVLVLARAEGAEPRGAQVRPQALPPLGRLHEDHRLRARARLDGGARTPPGQAGARGRHPGRRGAGRQDPGVPRLLRPRDRDRAGLGVPAAPA